MTRLQLRRALDRHSGDTGLLVYGLFSLQRGWTPTGGWSGVIVKLDRKPISKRKDHRPPRVDQIKPGPLFIPLEPGRHLVEFVAGGEVVRTSEILLERAEIVVIGFRIPRARGNHPARWHETRVLAA